MSFEHKMLIIFPNLPKKLIIICFIQIRVEINQDIYRLLFSTKIFKNKYLSSSFFSPSSPSFFSRSSSFYSFFSCIV